MLRKCRFQRGLRFPGGRSFGVSRSEEILEKATTRLQPLVVELGKHRYVSSEMRYWIMNVDVGDQALGM